MEIRERYRFHTCREEDNIIKRIKATEERDNSIKKKTEAGD